jgi:hypothetical protein
MSDEMAPGGMQSDFLAIVVPEDGKGFYEPLRPPGGPESVRFKVGTRVAVRPLDGEHEDVRYGRVIRPCRREPGRVHVEYESKIPRVEYCLPERILTEIEGES